MDNNVTIFNNEEFGQVRTVVIDDEPWFVGKDVASALGYENTQKALRDHVDNEDKKMGERNVTPSIKDSLGRDEVDAERALFLYDALKNKGILPVIEQEE